MAPLTRFQQKQQQQQPGQQPPAPAPAPAAATKTKPKKPNAPKNPATTNVGVTKRLANVKGAGPVKKLTKAQAAKKAKDARAAKAPVKKDAPKKKPTKAQAAKAVKKAKEEADAEAAAEKDAADKLVVKKKDKTGGSGETPEEGDEDEKDEEDGDEDNGDVTPAPTAGQEGGGNGPAAQPPAADEEILAAAAAIRLRRLGPKERLAERSFVTHEQEHIPQEVRYDPPGYDGDRDRLGTLLNSNGDYLSDAAFNKRPDEFQYQGVQWVREEEIGSGSFGKAE